MSEVEQNIVSVERILFYVKLKPEAPAEIEGAVPENWPVSGEVEFKYALCSVSANMSLIWTQGLFDQISS